MIPVSLYSQGVIFNKFQSDHEDDELVRNNVFLAPVGTVKPPKRHVISMPTHILQIGMQYIKIPKENEMHIVIIAWAYALQGCLLPLIALNSAAKVETVLKLPNRPN